MAAQRLSARAISEAVSAAHDAMLKTKGGKNADYIPYLAKVPPELAGVAVVTRHGEVFETGDSRYEFAFESISKVVTLALLMEDIGPGEVHEKIGSSPTGLPFNSIMALELNNDKPLSPLVNAGAIAAASLVKGADADTRFARILECQSRLTGRQIALSEEVNASEQTTNFHNRAIAWLLYSAGTCYCDPLEALDVYTRQCSTLITAVDLATMGATFANSGVNPVTGEAVLTAANIPRILSIMMMEGLYTGSGDFAYRVGLPGKSGVGGGLVAVVPGQLAIAAFAPPLDEVGNSVRAQVGVEVVAKRLGMNVFSGRV